MKKNILVFSVILVLLGCDTTPPSPDTPPPLRFHKSYIQYFRELRQARNKNLILDVLKGSRIDTNKRVIYAMGGLVEDFSRFYSVDERLGFRIHVQNCPEGLYHRIPMHPHMEKLYSPEEWEELKRVNRVYDSLLNLIGDTAFNKSMRRETHIAAIITPLDSIKVTCDKAFNPKYPQGSNLSSLFTVFFDDPYTTVKSGYTYAPTHYVYEWNIYYNEVPISVAKANMGTADFANRPFIGYTWYCMLDVAPDKSDTYTFTIEVILTDGTTFKATTNPIKIKGKNG
ncbi:MAG: hypothetical protein Q4A56_08895 [Porphyromonadaceae bacterium]|nr:hypothetical protein [Porphyromonadaceae bacterium]